MMAAHLLQEAANSPTFYSAGGLIFRSPHDSVSGLSSYDKLCEWIASNNYSNGFTILPCQQHALTSANGSPQTTTATVSRSLP